MLRLLVCALLLTVGACNKKGGDPDGGIADDMSVTMANDLSVGDDLATGGGLALDMAHGPDLDIHLPLRIPPTAVPVTVDGGTDYYEMHVKEAQQQVLRGAKTTIWGFDGQWPGPTIHATLNRPVELRVFNDLTVNENITIHNHGHNSAPQYDGHPSNFTIAPTTSYVYHYPNKQAGGTAPNLVGAATYFIHDHEAGLTAPHFYKGVEAFYIIHPMAGSNEAMLNLPSGAFDIPLMIQDRSFNSDNSLAYVAPQIQNGFQGDTMVVNGTPHAFLSVARRKYRFRMLNGSNARRVNVGLSKGQFFVIGTDGGLLPQQQNVASVPIAPAERVDIVIDFKQYKLGDVVTMTNSDPFSPSLPEVMQFRVTSDATDDSSLPVVLDSSFMRYTDSAPVVSTRTRTITIDFDGASSNWRMNMHTYDPAAYEFNSTTLGDYETWSIVNTDPVVPHPFHQHLVEFQILDICANANPGCMLGPPASQVGWKDTVLVPAASTVRVKMRFYYNGPEDPATIFPTQAGTCASGCNGAYVFHCHNLEHEDHMMMLQQQIKHP